jgi:hypothetical protein
MAAEYLQRLLSIQRLQRHIQMELPGRKELCLQSRFGNQSRTVAVYL